MKVSLPDTDNRTRRLKILDVGPALPETVAFFSQVRSRLYIADLFEEQLLRAKHSSELDSEDGPDIEVFPTLGGYPAGEQFDICLFWDFFSLLDEKKLQIFNRALQPFIHDKTRAHAFSTQNHKRPISNLSYGIDNTGTLNERVRSNTTSPTHIHSLPKLKRCLPCLHISRSRLLADGRLEILMDANPG